MLPRIVLAAVAAGLLAACGSGTSASPPVAPTSTTQVTVTTSTAPSTVPATTLPATTSTTVDPKAKVIADFLATREAFNACGADPAGCRVETMATPGSKSFANLSRFFSTLASNGLRGRPGASDYVIFEEIHVDPSGSEASLRTCIVDEGVIFDPRTADPADVVVNDAVTSARTSWTLRLVAGRWLRSEAVVQEERTGENICPSPE